MKAMILAAGRGKRMREYCSNIPKPLLPVANTTLIENLLLQIAAAGIVDVVINVSYFAEKIMSTLGDGGRYGVNIHYSIEENQPLETGGGIRKALSLLCDSAFLTVSSDIWTSYPFEKLVNKNIEGGHLVLVDNPTYHPKGDFCLRSDRVSLTGDKRFTFGNIAVLHPSLFEGCHETYFPLSIVLKEAIKNGVVTGDHYQGMWHNIGTPEEYQKICG